MNQLAGELYRSFIPKSIRKKLSLHFRSDNLNQLRKEILHFYKLRPANQINDEEKEVIKFLKDNPISTFPYPFPLKYEYKNVKVFLDEKTGLHYALLEGKRLYYKRSWTEDQIRGCYSFNLLEQDIDSPHRYLTNEFSIDQNDVVIDAGAAEGNFTLNVIDKVSKVYLFETDEEWIEALKATFDPYKSKVEIIHKFVSDINDEHNITIDNFLKDKSSINFIKIDVEGAEEKVLAGCEKSLKKYPLLRIALCTYHKQNDAILFSEFLKNKGFEVSFSKGYMIFNLNGKIEPPYLRKGLIRATKYQTV